MYVQIDIYKNVFTYISICEMKVYTYVYKIQYVIINYILQRIYLNNAK